MFPVHDELVVSFRRGHEEDVWDVARSIEDGARDATGVRHGVKVRFGNNFGECSDA